MSEFEGMTAREQGYTVCTGCHALATLDKQVCTVCNKALSVEEVGGIQTTLAWLITSIVLYLPANLLPIMRTRVLGQDTESTILGGVVTLWEHGSYPIALVIFIASVVVPLGKIFALSWLCYSVQSASHVGLVAKTKMYRATEIIGRWSMIDVFVVVVLVALIRLGNIMSIYPGFAAIAFGGMVITTMLAAMSFDPKLLWQKANIENVHER